jgi:hypothetical protein
VLPQKSLSGKVKENWFDPKVRLLAVAAKAHMRTKVSYGEGLYSNNNVEENTKLVWSVIKETASSNVSMLQPGLHLASKDEEVKTNLIKFVTFI